jgi:hypothetical protein
MQKIHIIFCAKGIRAPGSKEKKAEKTQRNTGREIGNT